MGRSGGRPFGVGSPVEMPSPQVVVVCIGRQSSVGLMDHACWLHVCEAHPAWRAPQSLVVQGLAFRVSPSLCLLLL